MGETNGNRRSIFSMKSTASTPSKGVPRGRTEMTKPIGRFLVAVMAVAAMALAGAAGTGLAQAQTNTSTDRDALVALYNAADGPNWETDTNWLSDQPLGEWHGVTTDGSGRVTRLNLYFNGLRGAIPAEFGNLTNLSDLNLGYNDIPNISPLANLTNLTSVDLTEIKGSQTLGSKERPPLDISPLADLTNLTILNLRQNKLADLSPLADLTNLTHLDLSIVHVRRDESDTSTLELSPLASLAKLTDLDLRNNNILDISSLAGLTTLTRLDIGYNHISDISPLVGLTELVYLNGQQNRIAGVSSLSGLTALQEMSLSVNDVTDLSPLVANTGLARGDVIDVRTNPLNAESIGTHIPELLARGVGVFFDDVIVFTDPQIYNDDVFVLPVPENLARGHLPLEDYAPRFYEYFNDEFDFLLFVPNVAPGQHETGVDVAAYYSRIRNDVEGIGGPIFTDSNRWGSVGKLQGVINFGGYSIYHDGEFSILAEGPTLHELMHQWANHIVPTVYGHWGFSSANGVLGGFDSADLESHGGDRYTAGNFSIAGIADNVAPYSPIELYLAGLIPPEEVPDLWVAEDGEWLRDEEGSIVHADDGHPVFVASQVKTYTVMDIIDNHGARVPDVSQAQKGFRAAVILLVGQNHQATLETLETLEMLSEDVSWFSHAGDDGTYRYNFYEATGGRGTITMDGLSQFVKDTIPATLPGTPKGLTATANGQTQIDLSWSAPASDGWSPITGYRIEVSADGSAWSNLEAATGTAATSYPHSGLMAGSTRHYRVSAINSAGTGPASNVATGTTSPAVIPGAPTGLTTEVSEDEAKVDLSWTAPTFTGGAPITGYRIESSTDGNDPWTVVFTTTSEGTTYTDDGTDANGPMFSAGNWPHYRVAAVNRVGTGPFSQPRPAGGDPLIARYDANGNGKIDKDEVINAINDYLFGEGDEAISKAEVIELINLYLFG